MRRKPKVTAKSLLVGLRDRNSQQMVELKHMRAERVKFQEKLSRMRMEKEGALGRVRELEKLLKEERRLRLIAEERILELVEGPKEKVRAKPKARRKKIPEKVDEATWHPLLASDFGGI